MLLFSASQSCAVENKPLSYEDLKNPAALIRAIESGLSHKNRKVADELYRSALKRKKIKNNWSASAKYFAESALAYPTANALIGLAESEAHLSRTRDYEAGVKALKTINDYLNCAISIDKIQGKLSQEEMADLKNDLACIKAFISSEKTKSTCRYVTIIFR